MRPIRLNKTIIDQFEKLIDDELKNDKSALSKAKDAIDAYQPLNKEEGDALLEIKADFKAFLLKTPTDHKTLVEKWDNISSQLFSFKATSGHLKKTPFCERILDALNYEHFREEYAAKIAEKIKLKACPYCNAALTIVATKESGKQNARFQLDHYFPKSKYPLLSISFFNLIPSCGNCNNTKSSKPVKLGLDFHLYANETPIEGFKFRLQKHSIAKYRVTDIIDDIEIEFVSGVDGDKIKTYHHNKSFDIKGIYDTQKDIIQELFWKEKAYPPEKINELSNLLKLPPSVIKRMVIGNYIDKEDIHKRPLAKFEQDIARQLGLIK